MQGPSLIVDTACASSLVSLHIACNSLLARECDIAIAGGTNLTLDPATYIGLSSSRMLSPDGHCKTFDASANGYARGEGLGILILKRLSDAEKDRDRILAVIKGSAVNQDGRSSGLTVPNGVAQEMLIRRALQNAKLKPKDINYVEAHGTGTALGDPIEINALNEVFRGSRSKENPLLLGSVKSNIGHLEAAAGMSSVIKMILALHHKSIPGNLHFHQLNPKIDLAPIPAKIVTELTPWTVQESQKRIAGISGFSFTGTNAHIILEEAPLLEKKKLTEKEPPLYLFTLSAKSKEGLNHYIQKYEDFLLNTQESIANITYTASVGRTHEQFRLSLIAKDVNDLRLKLKNRDFSEGEVLLDKRFKIKFNYQDSGEYRIHEISNNVINIDIGPLINWQLFLRELSNYYLSGADIEWESFASPFDWEKITLPTYPFLPQCFWVQAAMPTLGRKLESVHPLLGEQYTTPEDQIIYRGEIHLSALSYLKDHQVFDHIIYPGAGYLEMMLAGSLHGVGESEIHLANISFEAALSFEAGKFVETQVTMIPNEMGYDLAIYSQSPDKSSEDDAWHCHAKGLILVKAHKDIPHSLNIDEIKSRLKKTLAKKDFYEFTNSIGLHYGEHFQTLNTIYIGQEEALGELQLSTSSKGYLAHPALLDGAFQLSAVSLWNEKSENLYLPIGCDAIELYAPLGDSIFAYWQESENTDTGRSGNLTLLSLAGKILATLKGLHFRKTTGNALQQMLAHENRVEEWIYEWKWIDKSLDKISIPDQLGHWLILSDGKISDALKLLFENKGASCTCIAIENHPNSKEDFIQLLQAEAFAGILHVSSTGELGPLNTENISLAQTRGIRSVLHLTQALLQLQETTQIPLYLITNGGKESNRVAYSTLFGLYKTIVDEQAQLSMKLIDLGTTWDSESLFQFLFDKSEEHLVRLEGSQFYVPRFLNRQTPLSKTTSSENKIKSNVSYLITGGVGGLGITLAKWLIKKGATQLFLTGRRPLDQEIKSNLDNLESLGAKIAYESLDMGDEKSVADLLNRLQQEKYPLKGIFHLAGVLDDATLMEQDWDHFEMVFRPKSLWKFLFASILRGLRFFCDVLIHCCRVWRCWSK